MAIKATYNGVAYDNVTELKATDGSTESVVTLAETGVIDTPTSTKETTIEANGTIEIDVTNYKTIKITTNVSGGTEKTLESISAVANTTSYAVGTSASDLDITVTGHYSDSSTSEITGYDITGTVAEGENTFTIEYNELTCTVIVTGKKASGLTGIQFAPTPSNPWTASNLTAVKEATGVTIAYTNNSGTYVNAGFPVATGLRTDLALEGTVYLRVLTKNEYGVLTTYGPCVYVNDGGVIEDGNFTQLSASSVTRDMGTLDIDDASYSFMLYKWEIPSGKKGYFCMKADTMNAGSAYFPTTDKIVIDEEYRQYFTIFYSDPTDHITEGVDYE